MINSTCSFPLQPKCFMGYYVISLQTLCLSNKIHRNPIFTIFTIHRKFIIGFNHSIGNGWGYSWLTFCSNMIDPLTMPDPTSSTRIEERHFGKFNTWHIAIDPSSQFEIPCHQDRLWETSDDHFLLDNAYNMNNNYFLTAKFYL